MELHISPYTHSDLQPPPVMHNLSLHDALPISLSMKGTTAPIAREYTHNMSAPLPTDFSMSSGMSPRRDRKSTRLNSSHLVISYAVLCSTTKNVDATRAVCRTKRDSRSD